MNHPLTKQMMISMGCLKKNKCNFKQYVCFSPTLNKSIAITKKSYCLNLLRQSTGTL